jgi:hypothetical protein
VSARRARAAGAATALALLTAGCGVPQDDEPRALTAAEVPYTSDAASAAPADDGDRRVELWFVRNGQVVPTTRRVEGPTPVPVLTELLFGGTSQEERDGGLISVVPSTLSVEEVEVRNRTAVLTLDGPDAEVLRTQPLAYAQIVATLTSDGAVDGVRFRLDGRDLRVPRGDGSLSDGPVTREDYAELLGPAEPPRAPAASVPSPGT